MYLSVFFVTLLSDGLNVQKGHLFLIKRGFFVTMETKQELKQNEKKKILVCWSEFHNWWIVILTHRDKLYICTSLD